MRPKTGMVTRGLATTSRPTKSYFWLEPDPTIGTRRCRPKRMPNSLSYDGGSRQRRKAGIGVLSLVVVEATGWSEATTMEVREGSSKAGHG